MNILSKMTFALCLSLTLALCFFFYRAQKLETTLAEKNTEISVLSFSAKAQEATLSAILENEERNNVLIEELEAERLLLKGEMNKQKEILREIMNDDEKSQKWAKEEIPPAIGNLLAVQP